ncbi:MAG TPA: glutamate-5-semialdehyde dehydrogenase [Candidatus Alectryocaccomicrobium excrementavium]|uniref:Gamma-glutamyl phosphate reductase n=1 Tax=Candidatus Alectryocaccomicrobium excrementavium TaxID=2840668 RepID=A0A9D1FY36_9FIRM|nr:glutamate-5-semialdehyde dehydrogenase [Candidatus Alectryocaccomicrobium excrementavium]
MTLTEMGARARVAANALALAGEEAKNAALLAISQALIEHGDEILAANREDIAHAQEAGLSSAMIERLTLSEARLAGIANAILKVRALPDPVGEVLEARTLYNGLQLEKRRVPMGVICVIYESRPNVTVDSAVLCLKAGSAAILRGGKETIRSNLALESVMRAALQSVSMNPDCVQLVHDTARETARELMGMRGAIDLLIPRGGAGLIRSVVENAKVPVIETGAGNCHIYVDAKANLEMAAAILQNAKMQRPSVCNAAETLLVHKDVAERFLPMAQRALGGCQLRGCERAAAILPGIALATEEDFATEYNDYILAVRVVDSLEEAIAHIARYTTHHSEAIVTDDAGAAETFMQRIDAAAVYHNASTRFTDGEEFGLGAEIGISTQKMHARGPMGLREICSYKYFVRGEGQVRG